MYLNVQGETSATIFFVTNHFSCLLLVITITLCVTNTQTCAEMFTYAYTQVVTCTFYKFELKNYIIAAILSLKQLSTDANVRCLSC